MCPFIVHFEYGKCTECMSIHYEFTTTVPTSCYSKFRVDVNQYWLIVEPSIIECLLGKVILWPLVRHHSSYGGKGYVARRESENQCYCPYMMSGITYICNIQCFDLQERGTTFSVGLKQLVSLELDHGDGHSKKIVCHLDIWKCLQKLQTVNEANNLEGIHLKWFNNGNFTPASQDVLIIKQHGVK